MKPKGNLRAAKPLRRTRLEPPARRAQVTEPPYADPHVRWCGRGEQATAPPIPILGMLIGGAFRGNCGFLPWWLRALACAILRVRVRSFLLLAPIVGAWLSLARAPGSGPGGRWFKSTRPDHFELQSSHHPSTRSVLVQKHEMASCVVDKAILKQGGLKLLPLTQPGPAA